eukprot:6172526-Pleurochrysis_carterae.AAC.1
MFLKSYNQNSQNKLEVQIKSDRSRCVYSTTGCASYDPTGAQPSLLTRRALSRQNEMATASGEILDLS